MAVYVTEGVWQEVLRLPKEAAEFPFCRFSKHD